MLEALPASHDAGLRRVAACSGVSRRGPEFFDIALIAP